MQCDVDDFMFINEIVHFHSTLFPSVCSCLLLTVAAADADADANANDAVGSFGLALQHLLVAQAGFTVSLIRTLCVSVYTSFSAFLVCH